MVRVRVSVEEPLLCFTSDSVGGDSYSIIRTKTEARAVVDLPGMHELLTLTLTLTLNLTLTLTPTLTVTLSVTCF